MFFRLFSYFKFLLKSSNQHGVHSPFVYNFVTKGLYKKANKNINIDDFSELKNLTRKEQKVLSKIMKYFNFDKIHLNPTPLSITSNKPNINLILNDLENFKIKNPTSYNTRNLIIFKGIYKNKKTKLKWLEIIKNKEATVTIDLFYFGLIFFRKEQAKEHFRIRV